MIQSFDVKGGPEMGQRNVPKLRKAIAAQGLDGFIVPHEDEYQNEYLPECNERLAWASGFTGSAGIAVILSDQAAIFVDGRYTVQAETQTDAELFQRHALEDNGLGKWLRDTLKRGQEIGYDPRLHTPASLKPIQEAVGQAGGILKPVDTNPVDQAWTDRPAPPIAKIDVQPKEYAGQTHRAKLQEIASSLNEERLDAALITDPSSSAWLFNIRGGDVSHSPLVLATALIDRSGKATLFVDPRKCTEAVRKHLGTRVDVKSENALPKALAGLSGHRVRVDPAKTSSWHFDQLQQSGAIVSPGLDPVALPRACKNETEIAGSQEAHRRDGAALTRFLHWFARTAPEGGLTEISAAQELERIRRESNSLKDLSFETISAFGPNAALPHYRVNTATDRKIKRGSLYLVDSGGQYLDGTTDVTRTIAVGRPKREMRERFTLVLKGHIALSTLRFPDDVSGLQVDAIARQHLWAAGLDFDHGTGHGVGAYLGVHEGPQRIAKFGSTTRLKPGMIVSNEPGFYKPGDGGYGIRIENLQYVTAPTEIDGGERTMMGFETLTLAPLDRTLIVKSWLTKAEKDWVNNYHARVLEEIGPLVEGEVRIWLELACAPLSTPASQLKLAA